jgi:hypothetical protein
MMRGQYKMNQRTQDWMNAFDQKSKNEMDTNINNFISILNAALKRVRARNIQRRLQANIRQLEIREVRDTSPDNVEETKQALEDVQEKEIGPQINKFLKLDQFLYAFAKQAGLDSVAELLKNGEAYDMLIKFLDENLRSQGLMDNKTIDAWIKELEKRKNDLTAKPTHEQKKDERKEGEKLKDLKPVLSKSEIKPLPKVDDHLKQLIARKNTLEHRLDIVGPNFDKLVEKFKASYNHLNQIKNLNPPELHQMADQISAQIKSFEEDIMTIVKSLRGCEDYISNNQPILLGKLIGELESKMVLLESGLTQISNSIDSLEQNFKVGSVSPIDKEKQALSSRYKILNDLKSQIEDDFKIVNSNILYYGDTIGASKSEKYSSFFTSIGAANFPYNYNMKSANSNLSKCETAIKKENWDGSNSLLDATDGFLRDATKDLNKIKGIFEEFKVKFEEDNNPDNKVKFTHPVFTPPPASIPKDIEILFQDTGKKYHEKYKKILPSLIIGGINKDISDLNDGELESLRKECFSLIKTDPEHADQYNSFINSINMKLELNEYGSEKVEQVEEPLNREKEKRRQKRSNDSSKGKKPRGKFKPKKTVRGFDEL